MQEFAAPVANSTIEDEISLLDLLVVVAENIKLLLLGPLMVGLVALGVTFTLPATFESTTVMMVERAGSSMTAPVVQSLVTSASVLDAVAEKAGLLKDLSRERARKYLLENIKVSVGKQDKLLTITAQDNSPERAQQLAQSVLNELFTQTQPKGSALKRLQDRLEFERRSLKGSQQLEATLSQQVLNTKGGTDADQLARAYAELLKANSERTATIQGIEAQIEGLTTDDVVQAPKAQELLGKTCSA